MKDSYLIDSHSIDHSRLLQALNDPDKFNATKLEEKWFTIIKKFPKNLRTALLLELNAGNSVTSIQFGNWPQRGSIVICLNSEFKHNFSDKSFGVEYRILNDPHYWNADIHTIVDGVEHLIIT